eukprot:3453876-Prymnesium_polylepis.1
MPGWLLLRGGLGGAAAMPGRDDQEGGCGDDERGRLRALLDGRVLPCGECFGDQLQRGHVQRPSSGGVVRQVRAGDVPGQGGRDS